MGNLGEAPLNPSQGARIVKANNATIAEAGEERRHCVQDGRDASGLLLGDGDGGGGGTSDGRHDGSRDGVHYGLRWS